MVHFRQPSAHVNKTDYMNLPCDASSSPLSSSIWALSCTRRTIDWHSLEEEPVCSSPRALGQNKSCLTTTILCGSSRMDQKKKNPHKKFLFRSKFTSWRPRLQASKTSALSSVWAVQQLAVPQRPLF